MGVDSKVLDLGRHLMDVRLRGFGSIEVEGRAYEHDIVIDRGAVRKRSKKPSKPYRDKFGHTPLSADEELPWGGPRMIIGTGAYGAPVDRLRHALGVAVPGGDHIGRDAGRAHPRDIAVAQLA
jgi:hypothetical protein